MSRISVPASLLTPEALESAYDHRYTPSKCNHPDAIVILDALMEASPTGELPTFPMLSYADSYFSNLASWFNWAVPAEVRLHPTVSERAERTYLYAIQDSVGHVAQYWGIPSAKRYADRCRTLTALDRVGILPSRPPKD